MDQASLFVDTLNDAVRDTCRAIGFKVIAKELWPEKSVEDAVRYLHDCLNADRPQFLKGEQILYVGRRGKEVGCHLVAGFANMDMGYAAPVPVDPQDERAELQRRFIESVQEQKRILARLERGAR